ncbi:MAG: hypothetical protein JEY71_17610 [Sphaerochaeta sp.]|nr:hypothetical protein [Sphaerochaeta sp.]
MYPAHVGLPGNRGEVAISDQCKGLAIYIHRGGIGLATEHAQALEPKYTKRSAMQGKLR